MTRLILDYGPAHSPGPARRRRRLPAVIALLLVLAALAGGAYTGGRWALHHFRARTTSTSHPLTQAQRSALQQVPSNTQAPVLSTTPEASPSPTPAPTSAILSVPYTVQAPFNNWKVHEESCEEAALLMYHDFLSGDHRADIPPAEADKDLRALKAWQVTNWGAERDLSIERTGELAKAYWGYTYAVKPATEESIREEIAAGRPVVVPVMTHSLQNPNYGPKTVYHEVLIKGYTDRGVVSNDAGIKEGKDWFYAWSVLFGAVDAQTPKMNQGRVMLVLYHG